LVIWPRKIRATTAPRSTGTCTVVPLAPARSAGLAGTSVAPKPTCPSAKRVIPALLPPAA
jgi:hypothetical protein